MFLLSCRAEEDYGYVYDVYYTDQIEGGPNVSMIF